LNNSAATAATGGAQNWQGYFIQMGYTGNYCGFYDRKMQTGTANNNQDVVTVGTSSSCANPSPATIGPQSTAPSVALTVGSQYTEILTYTLTPTNTLQLASRLYTGTNSSGTLLTTMTAVTGSNLLTDYFDALAFGWRATGSTASTMTVNSILVSGQSSYLPPIPLSLNTMRVDPGNDGFVVSGGGGVTNGTYYVLTSTNLALPMSQWQPVMTNSFDAAGNFIFTSTPASFSPPAFYRFQIQ
jgi:hypothetical protein